MSNHQGSDHWLVRPDTIRLLWKILILVLALTVLAQAFIYVKGYFIVDGWFGFGAAYGFLSCLIMVLVSKGLGYILKRDDTYYQEQIEDD